MTELDNVVVGNKIYFLEEEEVRPYRVRACGRRYLVCTKPYNLKHTVIYTVIDKEEWIRGTENLVFCCGAETDEDCNEMLERLESGETEVSHRNRVPLFIRKVTKK